MSFKTRNSVRNKDLVDKILEQGQRLRNSMVQSILNNDPLYVDSNKHYNTPVSSVELHKHVDTSQFDDKKLESFLKGDYLSREDEKIALDTFRSMSDVDLCKTTERMYSANSRTCSCSTCRDYHSKDLNCDIKRSKSDKNISIRYENEKYFKFVDSLKVTVHSLVLNGAGSRKICDKNVPLGETYFLEYIVPDLLQKNVGFVKSKVNSGLDTNSVRICAKKICGEGINFKQTTLHDITNIENINLHKCDLKFKITYKNNKQKTSALLGYAIFHFNCFEVSKNLTSSRGLSIILNEKTPIVLGILKVSLQLGCGRLYFGKEFIDAINDVNSLNLDSDDSEKSINRLDYSKDYVQAEKTNINCREIYKKPKTPVKNVSIFVNRQKALDKLTKPPQKSPYLKKDDNVLKSNNLNIINTKNSIELPISKQEKTILFGFLYIAEAQYLTGPLTSYITCQPFCQNETSNSRLAVQTSNPVFNFCQTIPLVFNDDLLLKLRENYTLVEFFRRFEQQDSVFGLTKIPLQQFFIAYRNPVIIKYLEKNKFPVIGTDWWEPILHHSTEEVIGQVQILIALGTEGQIKNLEVERGFKNDVVKAKLSLPELTIKKPRDISVQTSRNIAFGSYRDFLRNNQVSEVRTFSTTFREQSTNTSVQNTPRLTKITPKKYREESTNTSYPNSPRKTAKETTEVGTQSDTMDKEDINSKLPEMLEGFFKQMRLANTNAPPEVNPTTTNGNAPPLASTNQNPEIRKTSDLLSSLQKVLNEPPCSTFRAHINIQGALHLPARKKCRSKRSKCKNDDNILPSTYVTFEGRNEKDLKITHVVLKSSSPTWNYNCDVVLSSDLLVNCQKRLIFKVWRKSTNTNSAPNMQSDLVLGFAALDLTVLLAGLPNVQGWFNIVDFTGKCNGQINIHVNPLENLSRFQQGSSSSTEALNDFDLFSSLTNDNNTQGDTLSRAVKRKFTELEEITRRLRSRLSTVTNDESDTSNDDVADEFENDINTLCVEDDFDLINFEEEATKFSLNRNSKDSKEESTLSFASSNAENPSSLDRDLDQGKQKIDNLLQKMSLLTGDATFQNRYVSGCSTTNDNNTNSDTEFLLRDLPKLSNVSSSDLDTFSSNTSTDLRTVPDGQFTKNPE
ncbi:unnamed protein product [Brassicogethes aeneus]|uniref:C2 domain-containing protein n=1 Tax=Brassicogethes aeneus TaxID=1431903 RepID=A0A9P0BE95_BRAAE|nr:unnamed protein product [Brassicogethes aeneus]